MKLNNLVMRGGVLVVLLSLLVVGCKGVSSGDTSAWTENTNKKKVWEKTNSSGTEYLRAYEQFGSTTKPDEVEVKLTVGNAAKSKAGLIFDLRKNDNDTLNYFVVGVGTQAANGTTPEYYISYYSGVTADSIAQTSSGEAAPQGSGTTKTIQNNRAFSEASVPGLSVAADGSLTVYLYVKADADDPTKIKVSASATGGVNYTELKTFDLNDYDAGADKIKGGIAAYAMLRPTESSGSSVSTKNTYEVLKPTVIASAEDAE